MGRKTTTATIIAALLLMVSCADRSHDSFIEDINGGKTTVTPTPTPKPHPTPVPTPQPKPKPVKPKQKINLTREYQEIESLKDFKIPSFLKGKFRAEIANYEVKTLYTINDNGFTVKTITDLSTVSAAARSDYRLSNVEDLNYFNYSNEEHQKAGTNIRIVELKVARNTPEYDGPQDENSISIRGTYVKDEMSNYVWIYFCEMPNGEVAVEYRKTPKYGYYDKYSAGILYPIK